MNKVKHLLIDGNAVLYRYFFGNKKESIEDIITIAHASMLYKLYELHKKYEPDNIIIVFDCKNASWRKVYTSAKNPSKITHRKYKGGRRENLSPIDEKKLKEFEENLHQYTEFFTDHTSLLCLENNYLEGDDLIAGYVQMFPHDDHVIYSSDKDFLQLVNSISGNVTLVESQKDTERSLEEWDNDPELFLFEKCFRGEPRGGDNVQNAYPRLLRKKIFAAYNDDFLFNNLLNNEFVVEETNENNDIVQYHYKTGDLLNENRLLMGLNHQPDYIKDLIQETIIKAIESPKRFNMVGFIHFCKNHGMDRALREKGKFSSILSRAYVKSSSPLESSPPS
jgi:hypothetical protein